MLVGASNSGSDSNAAMHRLRSRRFQRTAGMGDTTCDETGCYDTGSGATSIYEGTTYNTTTNPIEGIGPSVLTATGVPSTTSTSSSSLGSSIASIFSSLGTAAAKAFASTQTQCSVGTTLVGNQCLPTTTVNSLALQAASSATVNSLMSYAPLLIGLVAVMAVMNMSKSH